MTKPKKAYLIAAALLVCWTGVTAWMFDLTETLITVALAYYLFKEAIR